jgi:uncharacterized protein (DUF1330 family)
MTIYLIAQLRFTRRDLYDRYQSRFAGVFAKFKGRLVVADEQPRVLEGKWYHDKIVIMEFPDEPAAREFRESEEYRAIAADRNAGADAIVLSVKGLK